MESAANAHPRAAFSGGGLMPSFKIGDVAENWIGIPIEILDITPDYYIAKFGKWVERREKDGRIILHPWREGDSSGPWALPTTNGSGPTNGQLPPSSLPRPMSDLLAHQFKPQEYLVDGLIAKGHLGILGGRPKSGKSWLGLQLAMCIDTGADFLGRETTKARVLYYALEDGARRVQARAKLINWQPESAAVLFTIPYLDDGQGGIGPGAVEVNGYAEGYDLIIIDTLIAAMSGRTDERDNSAMGSLVNALAYIAHNKDIAIVIVHHTGKAANPDDIFATIRGASAIRGAYDMGLILERKPGEREAILHAESRDLDIRNMTLRQAEEGAGWVYVGDAYELEKIRAGRKVLEAMLENDTEGEGMTAKQLAEIRKVTEATIGRQLARLEVDGYICRDEQPSTQMGKRPDIWRVKAEFR
ncbi:MAG: AAA family ATPase [Candidatus Promineofilum sp.]|nr:AAA family ATPase [Promineifilum sp.]